MVMMIRTGRGLTARAWTRSRVTYFLMVAHCESLARRGKNPIWLGQLPRGLVGDNGKKSLSKGWGGLRTSAETEDEACTEVMEWLWRSCGQRPP